MIIYHEHIYFGLVVDELASKVGWNRYIYSPYSRLGQWTGVVKPFLVLSTRREGKGKRDNSVYIFLKKISFYNPFKAKTTYFS